jgi:hypothetical protein
VPSTIVLSARELPSAQEHKRGFGDFGVNKFGIDADDFPIGVLVAKTVFLEPLVQCKRQMNTGLSASPNVDG